MDWKPKHDAVIREHYGRELGAPAKIAGMLRKAFKECRGVTRNAVIGRAHRLGLSGPPLPHLSAIKGQAR